MDAAVQATIKQHREEMKQLFNEGVQKLFEENPLIGMVGWAQYTPYFCDGDVCSFSRDSVGVISLEEMQDEETAEAFKDYPSEYYFNGKIWDAQLPGFAGRMGAFRDLQPGDADYSELTIQKKAVTEFFAAFDEDTYKAMFGDPVKVIITANEIVVEEYEHD